MHADRAVLESNYCMADFQVVRKNVGEPVVPFYLLNAKSIGDRYKNTEWDFVFLSHSPGYVPEAADPLLDVIAKRIHDFY